MIKHLGKYELIQRIGAGGMAEVFLAKTHGAEGFVKTVVIKKILPVLNQDPEFVNMFVQEARLAANLDHANIVRIIDFDDVEGEYYIAMEWVDGVDLRKVQTASMQRNLPIPVNLAVYVGVETLKGLGFAHTRHKEGKPLGLVHRDISPHNLLVSFAGEVKITDFGIAKAGAAAVSVTKTGTLKGKLGYMSPEQANAGKVDQRSDLFSLGIVLWEMLAQRRMYEGSGSEAELLAAVQCARVPKIRTINPDIDEELESIVHRLLASSVEERFGDASEAVNALSPFSGIGDSLALATYLKRLLPEEANAGEKGGTVDEAAVVNEYREARAEAETNAVGKEESTSLEKRDREFHSRPTQKLLRVERPETQPENERNSEYLLVLDEDSRSLSDEDSTSNVKGKHLLWLCLACFFVFSVFGWFAYGNWRGKNTTPILRGAIPQASVLIQSEPSGLPIWMNGIPTGKITPATVGGEDGRTLRVEVKNGKLVAAKTHVLEGKGSLLLKFPTKTVAKDVVKIGSTSKPNPQETVSTPSSLPVVLSPAPRSKSRSNKPKIAIEVGFGTLDVVVDPWAEVRLDGKHLGVTPIRGHRVKAGRHMLVLENRELPKKQKIWIRVSKGNKTEVREEWKH